MGLIEKFLALLEPAHWGVHPDDRKRPAADQPLRVLPMPDRLYVPLQQHIGAPARPIVLVGQKVLKGQLLAEAQGATSAAIHAPTSGTVAAIGDVTAPHPSVGPMPATPMIPSHCRRRRWLAASPPPAWSVWAAPPSLQR